MTELTNTLSREARARELDGKIQDLYAKVGRAWVHLGLMCAEFHREAYHQVVGFERFDDWAVARFGKSRSTVYARMGTVEKLRLSLPVPEIAKMTAQNAELLAKLPERRRSDPVFVEKAQTLTETEFKTFVGQTVALGSEEPTVRVGPWTVEASLADVIRRAIEIAKDLEDTDSTAVALERIFSDWLLEHEGERDSARPGTRAEVRISRGEALSISRPVGEHTGRPRRA
jgi:hypothetical protein